MKSKLIRLAVLPIAALLPGGCAASTGSDQSQSQYDGTTIEHAAAPRESCAWSTA